MSKESMPTTVSFTLVTITPVSIGSGRDVNVLDYILDTANRDVYILNHKKWFQYLYSIDKLSDYELYVENYTKGQKETIYEWMERTIGVPEDNVLSSVSKRQLRCVPSSISKTSLNDIKLCMSLPDGTPYIPGSSLKGVIIASIIAHIIKNDEDFRKDWRNTFVKAFEDQTKLYGCIKKYRKAIDELIVTTIKKSTNTKVRVDVKKLFHAISVSDVMLQTNDKQTTYILPRIDSIAGTDDSKALPIYRECIIPNTKLEGMLSVDFTELKKVNIKTISDLIKIIEEHTQRLVSRWKLAFNKGIEESCIQELEQATCLLGSSIGFLHKTLLLPLFEDIIEEVNVVKSVLGLQREFKRHRHWQDKVISPRTLKLTKYKGRDYIFGGVKLHLEND